MKIIINTDEKFTDTEIIINTRSITPELEKIIGTLRIFDRQIAAVKGDEAHIVDVNRIIYVESVDRKTFIYTADDCYELKQRLYEIEEQLCHCGFFRVSKSCLVQLKFVRSLKSELNRKIRITLENSEQIIASRQYAEELKRRLGVK